MNNSLIIDKFPNGTLTYDNLKKSVLSFRVFYDELSYTQINQQPLVLLTNLISNIGGILGLFLGVSFLTIIEFLDIFLEILFILFENHTTIKNRF